MTTPTNQEDIEPQIKRLVTNVYIDAVEAAQGMPLYRTRTLGSVTDPVGEATQAINTIIANKCNEARIDELERLTFDSFPARTVQERKATLKKGL